MFNTKVGKPSLTLLSPSKWIKSLCEELITLSEQNVSAELRIRTPDVIISELKVRRFIHSDTTQ